MDDLKMHDAPRSARFFRELPTDRLVSIEKTHGGINSQRAARELRKRAAKP